MIQWSLKYKVHIIFVQNIYDYNIFFSAQPESVTFYPSSANIVGVSWNTNPLFPTSLRYISFFSATGAVISRYETVLSADVGSTDVAIDIDKDGYEHNFILQYIYTRDYIITPAPVTIATFAFGIALSNYCKCVFLCRQGLFSDSVWTY